MEKITNAAPNKLLIVGTSSHIKYPKIIAKTKAKYLRGVTRETSEYLYDWLSHKFATPPKIPIMARIKKSLIVGITQPSGIENKLNNVIEIEKNNEISHTGSDVDSFLIVIATYDNPIQKIIGKK